MNWPPPEKETGRHANAAPHQDTTLNPDCTWQVVAVKSNGNRLILCMALDRAAADAWVTRHKPFAHQAGARVFVEPMRRGLRSAVVQVPS
jgi:hypothetical protein